MVAYLNGELNERARRRMARFIDGDARCYAEYQRQRDIQRSLAADLPAMGRPQAAQLDRIWAAVKADLTAPEPSRQPVVRARYGLVMMLFITALVFPLVFGDSTISQAAATPPTPGETQAVAISAETESPLVNAPVAVEPTESAAIELMSETEPNERLDVAPQRTPEATR